MWAGSAENAVPARFRPSFYMIWRHRKWCLEWSLTKDSKGKKFVVEIEYHPFPCHLGEISEVTGLGA